MTERIAKGSEIWESWSLVASVSEVVFERHDCVHPAELGACEVYGVSISGFQRDDRESVQLGSIEFAVCVSFHVEPRLLWHDSNLFNVGRDVVAQP